jgi:hypothetical protein
MNSIKKTAIGLLVIFLVLPVLSLGAADKKKQELSPEDQKVMDLYKKYASPGENHKFLDYFVGKWESSQKIWMEAGKEPLTRKQEISVESLFEGRFTSAHIKTIGEVMGMTIEGIVVTGYDNYKKQFVSVTFGTSGTDFVLMYGTLDNTGKTRTDTGYVDDVVTGERIKLKGVTTLIDNDTYMYEMFQTDPRGNEFKYMEITYTRKK